MSSLSPEDFLLPSASDLLRHHIASNGGNEILVVGKVNEDGFVYEVTLFGRGTDSAVPAVLKAARPGDVLIHNHPSGDIRPSEADIAVASDAAERRIGSYIVDNAVTRIFPIVRWIPVETEEIREVPISEVDAVFASDGILKQRYRDFEFRPPQRDMARAAAEAVNGGNLLVVEAGTGTGKSFGYLVPILFFVTRNEGSKAVISTSTIALEEQLAEKDIPFLKEHLGFGQVPVAVLKGRQNYLCLRKFDLFRQGTLDLPFEGKDPAATGAAIGEIAAWIALPHDGSKSALSSAIDGDLWGELCSDEHACERARCRFFPQCFFYKSRRAANFAKIILVNHHLLMADVALRMEEEHGAGIIPPYDILVVDEAHNLFKAAVSFLGETVSLSGILRLLRRLFHNERGTGLLSRFIEQYAVAPERQNVEKIAREITAFIPFYIHSFVPECLGCFKEEKETYLSFDDPASRATLKEVFGRVRLFLSSLVERLDPITEKAAESVSDDPLKRSREEDTLLSLLTEMRGVVRRLMALEEFFSLFFSEERNARLVFWGEKAGRSNLRLSVTPLDVQKVLAENIYQKVRAVVFTSATLVTSRGPEGFDFFVREAGLDRLSRDVRYLHLPGCFDYRSALRAFVVSDLPDPNEPAFEAASVEAAGELIRASKGGALVLFTSVRHRDLAKERLKNSSFPIIVQDDAAAAVVARRFRGEVDSSLLATDTFWEGIDVKGDALRNLVIVRLPFRYPSHPFVARFIAKLEKETGGDGFTLFTLPHAILKFRQGIGRLIRSKDDRGTVVVFDRRLTAKRYGKAFLEALPDGIEFLPLPLRRVVAQVKRFFDDDRGAPRSS